MVFGRKKKRQKNDVKSADNSFTKSGSKNKVRRKPSFVSTPIKGRKMVKHRKSSGKRRTSKTVKSKKCPVVPVRQHTNVAPKPRVPPPPPIGQMNNRLNVIKSSMIQQQKQMMVREKQKYRDSQAHGKGPSRNNNNHEPAATSTLSQSVGNKCQQHIHKIGPPKPIPRDRTKADLQKWLQWRKGVNNQLVGYVLSGEKGNHPQPPVTSQFSGEFTADTIDSILHHAFNMDEPKSSLDKLSYMIYGIPRVKVLPVVKRKTQTNVQPDNENIRSSATEMGIGNVAMGKHKIIGQENSTDYKTTIVDNDIKDNPGGVSRCSSNASGGRLPRRNIQGNLFIQTNPLHNIPRYLPEPQSAIDNGYHVPPVDYIDEDDNFTERIYNQNVSTRRYKMHPITKATKPVNQHNMALNDNMNIYRPNDSISSIRVESPPPRRPPSRTQSPAMIPKYSTTPTYYSMSEDYSVKAGTTQYPQPHSPMSVNIKPPIAGAVPTLLSGLQPYALPQLRHVSNKT